MVFQPEVELILERNRHFEYYLRGQMLENVFGGWVLIEVEEGFVNNVTDFGRWGKKLRSAEREVEGAADACCLRATFT